MSCINIDPCQTQQATSCNNDHAFQAALTKASCEPQHQSAGAPLPQSREACAPQPQPSPAPQPGDCSTLTSEISDLQSEVAQLKSELTNLLGSKDQCGPGQSSGGTSGGSSAHGGGSCDNQGSQGSDNCGNSHQTNWGNSNWGGNDNACNNTPADWCGSNWGGNYQNNNNQSVNWGGSNWAPQGNDCSGSHGSGDHCGGADQNGGSNGGDNCSGNHQHGMSTNVSTTNNGSTGSVTFGNDQITFDKSNSSITVKDTCTGETTTIWGDPHVTSPDGTSESYNGNLSFNLGNGTTLTVLTADGSNNAITTAGTGTAGVVGQNAYSNTAIISNGHETVTVNNISQANTSSLTMSEAQGPATTTADATALNEVNKEWVAA